MKFLIPILVLTSIKAMAISPYSQCSLDERPLLLSHSFTDEESKQLFEFKTNEKMLKHEYQTNIHKKKSFDFYSITTTGSNESIFTYEGKEYHLQYVRRANDEEVCWNDYEKNKNADKKRDIRDIDLLCEPSIFQEKKILNLNDGFFYSKRDVEGVKKAIANSEDKKTELKKNL